MKTVDFSETISASDPKISRSRHLIEFMMYVSIEGQGLTLAQCNLSMKIYVHTCTKPKQSFARPPPPIGSRKLKVTLQHSLRNVFYDE